MTMLYVLAKDKVMYGCKGLIKRLSANFFLILAEKRKILDFTQKQSRKEAQIAMLKSNLERKLK